MLLIDAHLDLGMNAIDWGRDLEKGVPAIRQTEAGMTQLGRGRGTTALPELRQAEMTICLATVFCRSTRPGSEGVASQEIAYAKAQSHLAYYRVLEAQGKTRILTDKNQLDQHLRDWQARGNKAPLGFIISMEGADPIVWPEQVESWWRDGLRVISLSHYGVSAYSHGTGTEGGLTANGKPLLQAMEKLGVILDLTHTADQAFWEALDAFGGSVLASHNNCRALVPGQRQFTDAQVKAIIARDGVIGAALDAWMLYPDWVRGETPNTVVTLDAVAAHIDRVCQLAGDSLHAAIGSDLDGGYGTEQCPCDLDTIADLQKIPGYLEKRGYRQEDIERIMHGNWIRFFREAWA